MDFIDFILILFCIFASLLFLYKIFSAFYASYSYSHIGYDHLLEKKRLYKDIIFDNNSVQSNDTSTLIHYKVFCASERSISNFFKLFPWESVGFLTFDGNNIHFFGYKTRGTRFSSIPKKTIVKYRFPRNQVKISYLPPNLLKDGGLEWLKLEAHKRKFYFTTGNSKKIKLANKDSTTLDIYEIVSDF